MRYDQPAQLYRTGIEPVLLAAAIPAAPGQRLLEVGTGAGAALLCLAARVADISGVGVEIQPELAALARGNIVANGFADGLAVYAGSIAALGADERFDHVFANPPWHGETASRSPSAGRDLARRTHAGLIAVWTAEMAGRLRHRGTMTFIVPTASLQDCLAAMTATGCGDIAVLPLWPKTGRAAKIILLQAIRGRAAACRLLPGITLHRANGAFTAEAEAILRGGKALSVPGEVCAAQQQEPYAGIGSTVGGDHSLETAG